MSRDLTSPSERRSQRQCYWPGLNGDSFTCPCCKRISKISESHRHHVRLHVMGGLNAVWNVVAICATCHVSIHSGTEEDKYRLGLLAKRALVLRFGLLHLMQYPYFRDMFRLSNLQSLSDFRQFDLRLRANWPADTPIPYADALKVPFDETANKFVSTVINK